MSLKNLLSGLWDAIGSIFNHAEEEVRLVILPAATTVVNALKVVTDLDQSDLIGALAGGVGVAIEDKIRVALPIILTDLKLIDAATNAGNVNAQVKAALGVINVSSNNAKAAFYHSIASMLVVDLSDGKLSWSEAVTLMEYYYHNEVAK